MTNKIPRLLLFDIDGTLTRSYYNGTCESYICQALSIGFEREVKRNGIIFCGGTDGSIAADLLAQYNVTKDNCPDYDERIKKSFDLMPQIIEEGIKNGAYTWKSLLNSNELLMKLSKRSDVKLGLLTGNHRVTAEKKLKIAGINVDLFKWGPLGQELFGSFGGSDDPVRDNLPIIARDRYMKFLGENKIDCNKFVVIGDTPLDIQCAHVNNMPCVAVDTGRYSADELKSAEAVLPGGFADLDKAVDAMIKVSR